MSSKPALSIVDRDRSARGDSAPRASLTLPTRQNFAATSICFGAFCLWPVRRLLLQDNQPVRIGSRALDILIALLERPGDLVTKDELMARVWPNTFVEPANLTVHIAALRRALGDGRDGNRFLINIPGRGYRFVAPVTLSEHSKPSLRAISATGQSHNLPAKVTRLIGRQDIVGRLSSQIARDRFLTVVGPGGIGKTAVVLTVAEKMAASYRHGTWWIDLATGENRQHVAGAVASVLGLELDREESPASLVTALRDKEMLLVLDTCEHVVAAVAGLVAAVLREAPGVHVLATSREPLHSEGEQLCRLAGLESPPADCASAEQALRFPAVELFVERAAATIGDFTLSAADSTAFRLQSSSSRAVSAPLASPSLRPRWKRLSSCSPAAIEPVRRGSTRCAPASTGAMTCSQTSSKSCCAASPPSPVSLPCMTPSPSFPIETNRTVISSMKSQNWW